MAPNGTPPAAERTAPGVQRMFDRVAPRYDLANTVFSLGQDRAGGWAARRPGWPRRGRRDGAWAWGLAGAGGLAPGDGCRLRFSIEMPPGPRVRWPPGTPSTPLADASVDVVTIAFGLRNLPEPGRGLLEFRRVLRPGGRLVVCEFSAPVVPVLRDVYRRYLTRLMPVAARRLTSDPEAYQYLARSIGAWPDQPALARWLQDAGFAEVAWRNVTGGIVALHRGVARP